MFNSRNLAFAALMVSAAVASWAQPVSFGGIGHKATAGEIKAWNIDVRPDFKGLPKGSGSVAQGQDIWEAKCSTCHGIFGDSGDFFAPLIGGTTKDDILSGHVKKLTDNGYPGRTMIMKLSTLSTLWDFINRAMPWNAPKSLSTQEVYAVTAYLLNLAEVVPNDFVLSDANIAEVQKRIPNRNGMTTQHAMWPGNEFGSTAKPDVQGSSCMKNCATQVTVASSLPDFARNSHGNLAEQVRLIGEVRGADTTRPEGAPPVAPTHSEVPTSNQAVHAKELALMQSQGCAACHKVDSALVGPAFASIATKHANQKNLGAWLAAKVRAGSQGVWGAIPMPPQTSVSDADLAALTAWIAGGAKP